MGDRLFRRGSCPLGVTRVIRPSLTGTICSSASSSRWCGREVRLIFFSISLPERATACYVGYRLKCATCRCRWWRRRHLSAGARRDPSRKIRHRDWPPPPSPGRLVAAGYVAATRRNAYALAGIRLRCWPQLGPPPRLWMGLRRCPLIRWIAALLTNSTGNPPATMIKAAQIARRPLLPALASSINLYFRRPYSRIWVLWKVRIIRHWRHRVWVVDGDAIARIKPMLRLMTELALHQIVRRTPPMPPPRPPWPLYPHRWHWTNVWRWT